MAGREAAPGRGDSVDEFYVDDIDFNSGFVGRLSPEVMHYVCRFRGIDCADPGEAFRYCELGCGDGTTTNMLAGLYPAAEFIGVDFNAGHVETAGKMAAELGLQNVRFICCSFEELEQHDLPQVDYVGINGAYGWLTPALRQAVVDFVGAHLAEGGLFAVEYISLPGKAAIQAMWKTVQKLLPVEEFESSNERGTAGIKFLNALNAAQPKVFAAHPSIRGATRRYIGQAKANAKNVDHFVHNALAGGFDARYFCDVYDEMAAVGLAYAGRVDTLPQNDESFAMGPARHRLLSRFDSPRERELVKDFLLNTDARCDLYVKNSEQPGAKFEVEAFDPYYAIPLVTREELNERPYRQLFSTEEISFVTSIDGASPLGDQLREAGLAGGVLSLLNRLAGSGELRLSSRPWGPPVDSFDKVSLAGPMAEFFLQRIFDKGQGGTLPVPGLVTQVHLGPVEAALLVLLLSFGRAQALELLRERLGKQAETLPPPFTGSVFGNKRPKPVLDQAEEFYGGDTLQVLLRLGVLKPA